MALSDYQLSFGGLTMGAGTPYVVQDWGSIQSFDARQNDVTIPNGWGALAGPAYVDARTIVVVLLVYGDKATIHTIENALLPNAVTPDALATLGWKLPDREEIAVQARCDRRSRPVDTGSEFGLVQLSVMFVVPDPRQYGAASNNQALTPFQLVGVGIDLTAGSGVNLGIDLTVGAGADLGLDMSGTASVGDFVCTNSGNTVTYPALAFTTTVAMSSYRLTNLTNGDVASFTWPLGPTESLVADMAAAATGRGLPIFGGGSSPVLYNGVSRYAYWTSPRTPLRLSPGANTLRFEVLSGSLSSQCFVFWYNAYL